MNNSVTSIDQVTSVLLVTNKMNKYPLGGRKLLMNINANILMGLYGSNLHVLELADNAPRGIMTVVKAFNGYIDGLNDEEERKALHLINEHGINIVFVDGSNYGQLIKCIKKRYPCVKIVVFFHNVEFRFFIGSLRHSRNFRALIIVLINYFAEKKSVSYADILITLSKRNSELLKKTYLREATHIAPMALEDKMPDGFADSTDKISKKYILFVGGSFYANREGITWFVRHIIPHINIKLCIVGMGFDSLRDKLEIPGKVEVIGAVDSLADWYKNAKYVIAPIFDGSGMKTKVAEAMMYGKKVIGTPEAFSGYEDIAPVAGWCCYSAEEFINAIQLANNAITTGFDNELRKIFIEKYSLAAAAMRMKSILD